MPVLKNFISNIYAKNLFTKKDRLLIATSGGVDSVVLCKLCALAGFDFGIAHCNFQLRGANSERDESFVKSMAAELNAPFHVVKFDTNNFAQQNKLSIQEAARVLRYKWFEKIRVENNYDYILTAHHADDNIETTLMSFFRGTGIKGLTGIKERNGKIIRPLLFAKRKELEGFLQEQQLAFVQDESNLHDDYTRNFFRNTLIPSLKKIYPDVNNNLLANIERMKGAETLYQQAVELQKKKLVTQKEDGVYIPVLLLQKTPAAQTILFEIIKEYNFNAAQLSEVMALLESESGKYIVSPSHRILRNRKHLIISPLLQKETSFVIIEAEGKFVYANSEIIIEEIDNKNLVITPDPNIAFLDASKIEYPLVLRPWQTGDYFYPLGMAKKKKLSRFFIDKKLSLLEKEKACVIEMNKKIVWVVGQRIDGRFKISDTTKKVLRIVQKL